MKWLVGLVLRLFRAEVLRQQLKGKTAAIQFTEHNGKRRLLAVMHCVQCHNHWWIEDVSVELPHCCCYCGTVFEAHIPVRSDEIDIPDPIDDVP